MALFPHLELESELQINDKTRLSGVKSFVSKDEDALDTMTIKAGADGSDLDVFDADPQQRFLDWEFSDFTFDVTDDNNKLDFKENSSVLVATLTNATYSLTALASHIKTKLDAAGGQTYTVSYDLKDKLTISAPGNFDLLALSGVNSEKSILKHIGYRSDQTSKKSYEGLRTEYVQKLVTLEVDNSTTPVSESRLINLYSVNGDALFSTDHEMSVHEPDILRWVRDGRASFLDMHRRAQKLVLQELNEKGLVDNDQERIDKHHVVDVREVRDWATYMTLKLIFEGLSNAVDDVFAQKSQRYMILEKDRRAKAFIRLDLDKDGVLDDSEVRFLTSVPVVRR